jgi:glycosyltransferase involved in cell wall biosynthesis
MYCAEPMLLARIIADVEPGGAQLHVIRVTRQLARHGIRSRILAGHASPAGLRLFAAAGVELEVWGAASRRLQYAADPAFAEWLAPRIADADLVHAHMFGGWWAAARAIGDATPLVASEHNPLRWPGRPLFDELAGGLARVDRFFAHGSQARETVLAAGIDPDRVREGLSPVAGLDARPLRGLPSPRIVFTGRLHEEKGPDVLLEALALMRRPPPCYLLGTGPIELALREQAARLRLGRRVQFVGGQDDPAPWVAGASVLAQPSRDEAWSQSAVVAMGLGVTVVGTAVDDLPRTLADGRGIVVAPEDPQALAAALRDVIDGRLVHDREAGRAYARRFSVERVTAAYARAYEELVAGARDDARAAAPTS